MNLRKPFFSLGDQSHLNMVGGDSKTIYLLKLNKQWRSAASSSDHVTATPLSHHREF